jgi:hypothetical protein
VRLSATPTSSSGSQLLPPLVYSSRPQERPSPARFRAPRRSTTAQLQWVPAQPRPPAWWALLKRLHSRWPASRSPRRVPRRQAPCSSLLPRLPPRRGSPRPRVSRQRARPRRERPCHPRRLRGSQASRPVRWRRPSPPGRRRLPPPPPRPLLWPAPYRLVPPPQRQEPRRAPGPSSRPPTRLHLLPPWAHRRKPRLPALARRRLRRPQRPRRRVPLREPPVRRSPGAHRVAPRLLPPPRRPGARCSASLPAGWEPLSPPVPGRPRHGQPQRPLERGTGAPGPRAAHLAGRRWRSSQR